MDGHDAHSTMYADMCRIPADSVDDRGRHDQGAFFGSLTETERRTGPSPRDEGTGRWPAKL